LLTKLPYLKKLKTNLLSRHCQLAEKTGVLKSTIACVIQQLTARWTLHHGQQGTPQKQKREGKDPDVEEALKSVVLYCNWMRCTHQRSNLRSKSEELAKNLGHNNFKPTDGWLSQQKSGFEIKFKTAHDEKDCADAVNAE
jgi:hypothetical protein